MTLDFVLLIVDDAPDQVEQALKTLGEHLERVGFSLVTVPKSSGFSDDALRAIARAEGRDYDLVMVDYRLTPDRDGAVVAHRLRAELPYTDMVFYSSDPLADLLNELARRRVSGVFVTRRQELVEALTGLADTVIRKTVDLNHMRGIAMAEVADMDTLMEETLRRALDSGHDVPRTAAQKLSAKIRESLQEQVDWWDARVKAREFADIVSNARLFTFAHKYQLIRSIGKKLLDKPASRLEELRFFTEDIIERRNMLAHVKAETRSDGKIVLRSIKGDVVIDEPWMAGFRGVLKQHKPALVDLCEAVDRQVGGVEREAET